MMIMNKRILGALVAAGLIIGISLGLKYLVSTGSLEAVVSKRIMGVLIGFLLAVSGNYIPKTLEPLAKRQCHSAKWVALRRFSGWAFVLAGLSYAGIWMFAPLDTASALATSVVAASVFVVLLPFVWLIISSKRSRPTAGA